MREGVIDEAERERIDAEAIARVDAAVEFAEASPFPTPESLYDDVYVLPRSGTGELDVRGWYSLQTTDTPADARAQTQPPDGPPAANDEIPQQLTDALAAGEDRGAAAVDPETGGIAEGTG